MSDQSKLQNVFERLKKILTSAAGELVCVKDEPGDFYLDTKYIMKNKRRMFFGSVQINKAYVSYHLMPVYVFPELLKSISPELKNRMHGKSCFNFKTVDEELCEELTQLANAGYEKYKESGYVSHSR